MADLTSHGLWYIISLDWHSCQTLFKGKLSSKNKKVIPTCLTFLYICSRIIWEKVLLMLRRFCFVFFYGMPMNISQNEVLLCWNINWGMLEILRVYLSKHPFKVGSSIWEVFRNTPQTGACITGHCRWAWIIVGPSEFWLCAWWKQVFWGEEVSSKEMNHQLTFALFLKINYKLTLEFTANSLQHVESKVQHIYPCSFISIA